MRIGVVKEIKNSENRVALTPSGAQALHQAGHTVLVQGGAGLGSGFSDEAYLAAGATIVAVEQAWEADLVMKVKEPLESEYPYLKDQMLVCRDLAADLPFRADLRAPGRHPLLRHQYARGLSPNLNLGPHDRHAAVCPAIGRTRHRGPTRRPRVCQRGEYAPGRPRL